MRNAIEWNHLNYLAVIKSLIIHNDAQLKNSDSPVLHPEVLTCFNTSKVRPLSQKKQEMQEAVL